MFGALLAFAAAQFAAGVPAFDPRLHKNEIAGQPAQALVLGTMHLSQLPQKLDPALLEPLLASLARFKPEIITVEGLSGEECDTLNRFKAQHPDAYSTYCPPTDEIEKASGFSIPAAATEVDRALASWPGNPTPAQRRRLAMLFLAAGDRGSATVQWLRLPETERHAGDGLTDMMVDVILRKGKAPNEIYAIGSVLAARLGLERIYLVDDHIADGPNDDGYDKAMGVLFNAKPPPRIFAEYKQREANLKTSADVLDHYRWLNEPATQRAAIAADMGRAERELSARHYGRQYVAWWENRNLRMIANIRRSLTGKPDARALVIVGSTHKGYFDAYLNMMQDVRLIDIMPFLN